MEASQKWIRIGGIRVDYLGRPHMAAPPGQCRKTLRRCLCCQPFSQIDFFHRESKVSNVKPMNFCSFEEALSAGRAGNAASRWRQPAASRVASQSSLSPRPRQARAPSATTATVDTDLRGQFNKANRFRGPRQTRGYDCVGSGNTPPSFASLLLGELRHGEKTPKNRATFSASEVTAHSELILSWADAHHQRTGSWPRCTDREVADAPAKRGAGSIPP